MTSQRVVYLLNGPNLNLLGQRQPQIYGSTTLTEIETDAVALGAELDLDVRCHQSNHEGVLIDLIHDARAANAAVVINAGALTHTSLALADALAALDQPYVEIHISNVHGREEVRHHSWLSAGAAGLIVGCGAHGYSLALRHLAHLLAA